jgi:hypothetical protein
LKCEDSRNPASPGPAESSDGIAPDIPGYLFEQPSSLGSKTARRDEARYAFQRTGALNEHP